METLSEKTYIGREEAFELIIERGWSRLPRAGREYVQSVSIMETKLTGKQSTAIGKDANGYYIRDIR